MKKWCCFLPLLVVFVVVAPKPGCAQNWNWTQTNGPGGEDVRCLATVGTNIFAGTYDDGIFQTTTNGTLWSSSDVSNIYVSALTVSGTSIFAGTYPSAQEQNSRIYISNNGGATFNAANIVVKLKSGNNLTIYSTVHAFITIGGVLYAGTDSGGVYSTSDNGTTWFAADTGLPNSAVNAFALVGGVFFAGTESGVYLTTNGGTSWSLASSGLNNSVVQSLIVSGDSIYAGTLGGVFFSNNNGASWLPANTGLTNLTLNTLIIDNGSLYAGTPGGVYLSTNNGASWSSTNNGLTDASVQCFAKIGTKVFAGTDRGIYLTTNAGASWLPVDAGLVNGDGASMHFVGDTIFSMSDFGGDNALGIWRTTDDGGKWTAMNNGIPYTLFTENISVLTDRNDSLFATAGGGGIALSTNAGASWKMIYSGAPCSSPGSFTWFGGYLFAIFYTDRGGCSGLNVCRSSNNGVSWAQCDIGLPANDNVIDLAVVGHNLFAATGNYGVFISTDTATSWTSLISSPAVVGSMASLGTTLVVYGNNTIYYSTNLGSTWTAKATGSRTFSYCPLLVYAGNIIDADIVNAVGSHVYLTPDTGKTWFTVGFNTNEILSLAVNKRELYAGSLRAGVWKAQIPAILVTNQLLDYGTFVCEDAQSIALDTVWNILQTSVNVTCSLAGANAADFTMTSPTIIPLAAGTSSVISVRASPTTTGVETAMLILSSDDSLHTIDTVVLKAQKDSANILLSSPLVTLGNVTVGHDTCVQIYFYSTGNIGDTIVAIDSAGTAPFVLGYYAAPWYIPDGTLDSIRICFTPPDTGTFQGVYTLHTQPCGVAQTFTIRGSGILPGSLAASTSLLDYHTLALCEAALDSVRVCNTGSVAITLQSPLITGVNSAQFKLVNPPAFPFTLAANACLTLVVECDTDIYGAGNRTASLVITPQDNSISPITIALRAIRSTPALATPSSIVYSATPTDSSRDTTIDLKNVTTENICIQSVTLLPEFTILSPTFPQTIAAGNSLPLKVHFSPRADSLYQDIATVTLNCPCSTQMQFSLSGQGIKPNSCSSSATIMLPTIQAKVGDSVDIPIAITSSQSLAACGVSQFTCSIRYDGTLLYPIAPATQPSNSGNIQTLTFAGSLTDTLGKIITLHFIAALGDSASTQLHFATFGWNTGGVQTSTVDGTFALTNVCQAGGARLLSTNGTLGMSLGQNYPNPFSGNTEISFEIFETGRTRVTITDIFGRTVGVLCDGNLAPGRYACSFESRGLSSGMYLYMLQTPTMTAQRIMMIRN